MRQRVVCPVPEHVICGVDHGFRDHYGQFGSAAQCLRFRRQVSSQLIAQCLNCGGTLAGSSRIAGLDRKALGERGCHWDFRLSAGACRMASDPGVTSGCLTSLY